MVLQLAEDDDGVDDNILLLFRVYSLTCCLGYDGVMVDIKPGKCRKREWEQNDWRRLRP